MPGAEPGAARAPATREQADAYRFGLRRLEAALVRGDPVPLHEQVRSQRRAAVAGVLLGLLGLGGAALYGAFVPRPDWRAQDVVVGADSGAMYVVARDPDRLVPVANLAAGRLVLAVLRDGGSSRADPATAEPVAVADADLDTAPRTASAAVAGAASVRLDGATVPASWAVCDEDGGGRTTVVGGAVLTGPDPGSALVTVPGGGTWLLADGRRHRVDPDDRPVLAALGLLGRTPRPASAAVVNAVPEGAALRTPRVPGAGGAAPGGVPGRVGDLLVSRGVGDGPPEHLVVLPAGVQQVPPLLAEVLLAAGADTHDVTREVLVGSAVDDRLDVRGWPGALPPVRDAEQAPVLCWTWTAGGAPGGAVVVGTALPVPPDSAAVRLTQADGPGERVDAVVLSPGGGGAVRATAPGRAPDAGPLWLVSATGVVYGVVDARTAEVLGVTAVEQAPEAALRLLPVGGTLDVGDAARLLDVPR